MEEDDNDIDESDMRSDDNMEMNTNASDIDSRTQTNASSNVLVTSANYAAQPLFGLSREQRRLQILQSSEQPVRQLGEILPEPQHLQPIADEDGFVSVSTSRRGKPK
jgi:hypothetical protein